MKKIFFFIAALNFCFAAFSQTGSVGIGTTTPDPSAKLDVRSTDKGILVPRMTTAQRTAISNAATGLLVFDNTTGTFWFYNGSAWTELVGGAGASHWAQTSNNIYNSNTGNVGIGTLAPAFKLDVLGRMRIKAGTLNNVNTSAGIMMDDYRDGSNRFFFGMKDSIRAGFYGGGDGGVGWNLLFNARTGRFSNQFNMDDDINIYNGSYNLFDGVTNHFSGSISADSNDIYINAKRSQISSSTGNLIFQVGNPRVNPPMGAGNVGIGTDAPESKLHISGTGPTKFIIGKSHTAGSTTALYMGTSELSNGYAYLQGVRSAGTAYGNLIINQNGGNVGIGTIAPLGKLHVDGTGELFRTGTSTTAIQMANNFIQFIGSGAGKFFMQLSGNDFTISPSNGNSNSRLVLNGNQVTIGQVTPADGYKLSIGGKAVCEELKVQLQGNWPDYVFATDYKLKTFDELRSFIADNKRLPNIPASSELEKTGIEVGEMQRKMMEKIEELTLYILQLEKEVNHLKKLSEN